jgi:hypothetical protein
MAYSEVDPAGLEGEALRRWYMRTRAQKGTGVRIPVADAARELEARGALKREREDHSERVVEHVGNLLGCALPADFMDFYRERISRIGEFYAKAPEWNDRVG